MSSIPGGIDADLGFLISRVDKRPGEEFRRGFIRAVLKQQGVRTSKRCLASSRGRWAGPLNGERVGVGPGLRPEGCLRRSAHPLSDAVCRDRGQDPVLLPAPDKWQLVSGLFVPYCSKFAPTEHACSYF